MIARHVSARLTRALLLGGLTVPALLSAQPPRSGLNRAPGPNAVLVMVPVFRSTERALGVQAAAQIRSRISSEFSTRDYWAIEIANINANLEASGFSTTEALAAHDATALARIIRADEYIDGTVSRAPAGHKLEVNLVLTRDNKLVQPLGTFEAPKLNDAAGLASKELKEARKQLPFEKNCVNAARERRYEEAIAFAKGGVTAYAKATLARICWARVLVEMKAPSDSLLKVAREILAIDPRSDPALRIAAEAYRTKGMQDSAVVVLTRLLSTDPTNSRLQVQVIDAISSIGNPRIALPIADTAVALNPGDPDLLKLRWLILFAVKDWKQMVVQGEALVQLDTSFADTTFFVRTISAFLQDSQPQKAAESAARGIAKFPDHPTLTVFQIQALQSAGQHQQALDVLDKTIEKKIPLDNAGARRLTLLNALNRNDEIIPAARALIAQGDTATSTRALLLNAMQADYVKAAAAGDTSGLAAVIANFTYADSVTKGPQKARAQFFIGAANLKSGDIKVRAGSASRSCQLVREAKNHFVEAQIYLPKGGSFAPEQTRAQMTSLMALDPATDETLRQLRCR